MMREKMKTHIFAASSTFEAENAQMCRFSISATPLADQTLRLRARAVNSTQTDLSNEDFLEEAAAKWQDLAFARPGADLPEPLHGQVQIPQNLCTARCRSPRTSARPGARLPEPLHGEVHSSQNLCTARCTVAGTSARPGANPPEPLNGLVYGCRSLCAAKCAASGTSARRAFRLLEPLRGKLRGCQSLCTGTFTACGSATKLENHSFRASRSSKNWLCKAGQLANQGTRARRSWRTLLASRRRAIRPGGDFWIFRVRRPAGRQRKNEKSTPNVYSERKDHFQYGKGLKLSAGHSCLPILPKKFWGRGAPTIS